MGSVVQNTSIEDSCSSDGLRRAAHAALMKYRKMQKASERRLREVVYFLEAGPFIKIGKTVDDASRRVSELQTGCPYPIRVIAITSGGYTLEKIFHDRFEHIRAHGEWFFDTQEIRTFIELFVTQVEL